MILIAKIMFAYEYQADYTLLPLIFRYPFLVRSKFISSQFVISFFTIFILLFIP